MPARLLSLPFVIVAFFFLYLTWEKDESYSLYIVPPVLVLALIYVFSPQINWWWYKRNPPDLDPPLRLLLERFYSFYQHLTPPRQQRFRERLALYNLSVEFMPQAMERVPEDVKGVVAAAAVTLTFGMEDDSDWRLSAFERVVVYPRPFPSPQYPEQFHASEVFEEDGVILFAAEQLMLGFTQPYRHLNLGLYEYARVFAAQHPEAPWPQLPPDIWSHLEAVSGISYQQVQAWINLPESEIDPLAVTVAHFLLFPRAFRMALPGIFDALESILGFDPGGKDLV